jgi:phosphohistidine phosphatase SixA
MKSLVLLRHATPLKEEENSSRPLSEAGKVEAEYAAKSLCAYLELPSDFTPKAEGKPCKVLVAHSGKERAAETAALVKKALEEAGCDVECTEAKEALDPKADTAATLKLVAASSAPLTVLVGHLPNLHEVALACGISIAADKFEPAGGVLLESTDDGTWGLAHHVMCAPNEVDPPPSRCDGASAARLSRFAPFALGT